MGASGSMHQMTIQVGASKSQSFKQEITSESRGVRDQCRAKTFWPELPNDTTA
ncbi:hypothetical protein BV95_00922 [Sphingobium chlorophenolicum]|jgi:hypothetical protein|nr:hypothetical protein BV97_02987 [Novosphingobium resinovorum]KEQ54693.1 hypothetical protein BV95_00922 [Sphingobium chlorophenolicum]